MITLVVARYKESMDWLRDVPAVWNVVVYDKSGDAPLDDRFVPRPNIGREAETFCWHNATTEPRGYTIYAQGNPFDHCPNFFQQAEFIMARGDRVGWLGPHYDTAWNVPPHRVEDLGVERVWMELFPFVPQPQRFSFPAGAQLVVWQTGVQARGSEWWRNAHEVASTDDWRVAHAFERLWPTIYRRVK